MKRKFFLIFLVVIFCLLGWSYFFRAAPTTNVLIITLDTTRADRLGCYGYSRAKTPALDSLAAGGVLFEKAYSPAPLTLPSHASLFTGLNPPEHGLISNGKGRLSDKIPTLATLLSGYGYDTAAFVASFVLDAKFGLDQGFVNYDDNLKGADPTLDSLHRQRDGKLVVDSARKWLQKKRTSPFFCWVHLYDPHLPYLEHQDQYGSFFQDPYDAEIAYMDEQIARLVAFLKEQRLDKKTVIIVVGDHGEGLGEHIELSHGYTLYNSTQHIPLIFHPPQPKVSGHRVTEPVAIVDVFPTLLEFLGISSSDTISGQSFQEALLGKEIHARNCYSATDDPFLQNGWSPLRSLTTETWKYIRSTEKELYNLESDPGETQNLANSRPEKIQEMEKLLRSIESNMQQRAVDNIQLSKADKKKLASLGYAGQGSSSSETSSNADVFEMSLPDVKEMLKFDVQSQKALDHLNSGHVDEAISLLEKIIDSSSKHVASRVFLGNAFEQKGQIDKAVDAYQQALQIKPDFLDAHTHLGNVRITQGKIDQAIAHFQDALEIDPESAQTHFNLGLAFSLIGRAQDALAHYNEAIRVDSELSDVNGAIGNLMASQGREIEAVEHWKREIDLNPQTVNSRVNLGVVLTNQKHYSDALKYLKDAVHFGPKHVQANYYLGLLFTKHEMFPEAVQQYERVLLLAPEHPHAFQQLERARQAILDK